MSKIIHDRVETVEIIERGSLKTVEVVRFCRDGRCGHLNYYSALFLIKNNLMQKVEEQILKQRKFVPSVELVK